MTATESIIFVTGANRGIGFAFAERLTDRGDIVIAGYRDSKRSTALLDLAESHVNLYAVQVDVTARDQIEQVRDFIDERFGRLDILINNAGVAIKYEAAIDEIEPDDLMENFRVNVVGPFLTAGILQPLLARAEGAKVINISSQMGSIEQASKDAIPYRISKAAVNMLSRSQALSYEADGIITVAMHPGWVRTDMGGSGAPLQPSESAANMIEVIDGLTSKDNGVFIGHDGRPRPY